MYQYFGFIICRKDDNEKNKIEIGYLFRHIEELLKTSKKNKIYNYIENIYNEFENKDYQHNIPLLYKIQFGLNKYSLKSLMNKTLSEKIKNIDIWTKNGIKEWYELYKEIEENKK
jgi:hypothetical protein